MSVSLSVCLSFCLSLSVSQSCWQVCNLTAAAGRCLLVCMLMCALVCALVRALLCMLVCALECECVRLCVLHSRPAEQGHSWNSSSVWPVPVCLKRQGVEHTCPSWGSALHTLFHKWRAQHRPRPQSAERTHCAPKSPETHTHYNCLILFNTFPICQTCRCTHTHTHPHTPLCGLLSFLLVFRRPVEL